MDSAALVTAVPLLAFWETCTEFVCYSWQAHAFCLFDPMHRHIHPPQRGCGWRNDPCNCHPTQPGHPSACTKRVHRPGRCCQGNRRGVACQEDWCLSAWGLWGGGWHRQCLCPDRQGSSPFWIFILFYGCLALLGAWTVKLEWWPLLQRSVLWQCKPEYITFTSFFSFFF